MKLTLVVLGSGLALAIGGTASGASGAVGGSALSVRSFEFVLDAHHVPATIPSDIGVMHVGTFTASAPFCASGTAIDLKFEDSAAVHRSYTCGDGTGSMTVRSTTPRFEHTSGGSGRWGILGGTGQYASLGGKGVWTSIPGRGEAADIGAFRSTSSGIAELDAEAPQIAVSRSTATRLRRPVGAYQVRLGFSARDNIEKSVAVYDVTIRAGSTDLALKRGAAVAGTVSLTLQIRPPKGSRRVQITITATDPLDNKRTLVRSLTLPP